MCSILTGALVAEFALHPPRRQLTSADEALVRHGARLHNYELTEVSTRASDGEVLRAWYIRPHQGGNDAVMLLHGVSDNRLGMGSYAALLLAHGYGVLMPDARANGASGGGLATYGLLERDDIHRWFEWLSTTDHPHCIFGFGESMGAAQILQALQAEPRFCAVAAESPFSSFREIAYDRMSQPFHAGPWIGRTLLRPVVETAFLYARWKYKLDMEQVSPEKVVAASAVPIFLIHGRDDRNIPVRHSERIHSRNVNVALWEVPKADHCGAISAAPQEFEKRLVGWFESYSADRQLPALHSGIE